MLAGSKLMGWICLAGFAGFSLLGQVCYEGYAESERGLPGLPGLVFLEGFAVRSLLGWFVRWCFLIMFAGPGLLVLICSVGRLGLIF